MEARIIRWRRSVCCSLWIAAVPFLCLVYTEPLRADIFGLEDEKEDREAFLLAVLRAQVEKGSDEPSILGDWDLAEASVLVKRVARVLRDTKVEVHLEDATVSDVLDLMRSISGLNFIISRKAQELIEARDPRITMDLSDLPLENFINLLALYLGDFRFTIRYGAIVMVRRDEYKRRLVERSYTVRDIVRRPPDYPAPRLGLSIPGEDEDPLFR